MKKILLLCISLFLLSGCQNVKDMKIDDTLKVFSYSPDKPNVYRVGYKYNLPSGMQVDMYEDFTELISYNKINYYLYVDVVSYYNKVGNTYKENSGATYSKKLSINDKIGYLEVNKVENDKNLIEIMYNYAKIEVMVDLHDTNIAIINAINILKSIKFSDLVLDNYFGDDIFNFQEDVYDIFKTKDKDDYMGSIK